MHKRAFLEGLQDQWHSLDPKSQLMAGTGAVLAGAGGLHSMLADNSGLTGPLLMAGGAGLGLYGLSGQNLGNIPNTLSKAFGNVHSNAPSAPSAPAARPSLAKAQGNTLHPSLQKFIGPDGQPRFTDIVKAPDEELVQSVGHMTPAMRQQFAAQLQGFQPSLGQRMGARALGIDIEAQRQRLLGILGVK